MGGKAHTERINSESDNQEKPEHFHLSELYSAITQLYFCFKNFFKSLFALL